MFNLYLARVKVHSQHSLVQTGRERLKSIIPTNNPTNNSVSNVLNSGNYSSVIMVDRKGRAKLTEIINLRVGTNFEQKNNNGKNVTK